MKWFERTLDVEKSIQRVKVKTKIQKEISNTFTALCAIILALIFIYAVGVMYDVFKLTTEGYNLVPNESYEKLKSENEDLVAWLTMEGTHVNHPVVQGKDNFEYLSINFYKTDYAGGTLFLDSENKSDFSNQYNIIHGHHMSMGAMFGDLHKYLERDFWDKHTKGLLKTPYGNYDLTVMGVTQIDAYDSILIPKKIDLKEAKKLCKLWRNIETDKVLALVTCTSSLNDTRTVVFCAMKPNGEKWS